MFCWKINSYYKFSTLPVFCYLLLLFYYLIYRFRAFSLANQLMNNIDFIFVTYIRSDCSFVSNNVQYLSKYFTNKGLLELYKLET